MAEKSGLNAALLLNDMRKGTRVHQPFTWEVHEGKGGSIKIFNVKKITEKKTAKKAANKKSKK